MDLPGSLHDEGNNHSVDLGTLQATLTGSTSLGIKTGSDAAGPEQVKWKNQNVWNNDGDRAYLIGPDAGVRSLACPEV